MFQLDQKMFLSEVDLLLFYQLSRITTTLIPRKCFCKKAMILRGILIGNWPFWVREAAVNKH